MRARHGVMRAAGGGWRASGVYMDGSMAGMEGVAETRGYTGIEEVRRRLTFTEASWCHEACIDRRLVAVLKLHPRCHGEPQHLALHPATETDSDNNSDTMPSLTAAYTAPASPAQTFSAELPAIASAASTADRVAYLAQLQASLKTLQSDVNAFLTQKMADDKAADDAKAEETYGEEVVDED